MKPILFRLMLVVTAFSIIPECWAADTAGGNIFVDARLGAEFGRQADSSSSNDNTHSIWGADGGYRWKLDDRRSAGFEVGYVRFGVVDDEFSNIGGRSTTSAKAMSAGGHLQILLGEDRATVLQARAGLMSVKFDQDFDPTFGSPGSDSWRQRGVYFGFGIGRKLTEGLSVLLAYSHYGASNDARLGRQDLDLNWIGVVAEYRFGD
jgi:hypothetical protein